MILFKIETKYRSIALYNLNIDGFDLDTVAYHCKILPDADLLDSYESTYSDDRIYAIEWSEVIQYIQDSPLYKDTALSSEKGWANEKIADPWLIAIAKSENYTIVTDEIKNINLNAMNPSKNAKIPDVCEEFKIRCISMNQFFSEIGLSI